MPAPQKLSRKEFQQKRKEAKTYGRQVLVTLHQLREYIEHASNLITTIEHPNPVRSDPMLDEVLAIYRTILREKIFPEALYYSFIVLLYGEIETSLKRMCDLFHEMRQTPLRAKELSGDTLSQCMTFLHRLCGIPSEAIKSLPDIRDLAKVRNCIVHASGLIERVSDSDKKRIQQLAANSPALIQLRVEEDPDDTKLVLSLEYCRVSVEHASDFFQELLTAQRLRSAEDIEFVQWLSRDFN